MGWKNCLFECGEGMRFGVMKDGGGEKLVREEEMEVMEFMGGCFMFELEL